MSSAIADAFRTPHRHIDITHGELAHWRFGEGPDLVFVHGWPLHGATFRRIIGALSERYCCHVFDLPGTGHTTWAEDAPFGLWEHARTLAAALRHLGVDQYALLAHNSGGTIARLLATIYGDVTAIVMGNTEVPGHKPPVIDKITPFVGLPGVELATKLLTRMDRVQKYLFEGCFADLSELETDFGELFVDPLQSDDAYIHGQLRLIREIDWDVVLHQLAGVHQKISAPVLLIWGDRDPWFPWRVAQDMVDSFGGPDAEVHHIEEGRLFVHEEYPDEFGRVTLEFLDRVVPTN